MRSLTSSLIPINNVSVSSVGIITAIALGVERFLARCARLRFKEQLESCDLVLWIVRSDKSFSSASASEVDDATEDPDPSSREASKASHDTRRWREETRFMLINSLDFKDGSEALAMILKGCEINDKYSLLEWI